MKIILAVLLSVCSFVSILLAQPAITSPTNNLVLYNGEELEITWDVRPGSWENIIISLTSTKSGTMTWIASSLEPNDGSFKWTVGKWNTTNTEFTIDLRDGGHASNYTSFRVTIPDGVRPPKPVGVPVQIKRVVSVEWETNPLHTYRLESSTNLIDWVVEFEGKIETTGVGLFYAENTRFFRVFDLTP